VLHANCIKLCSRVSKALWILAKFQWTKELGNAIDHYEDWRGITQCQVLI